jgi:hydrogenase-4 component E
MTAPAISAASAPAAAVQAIAPLVNLPLPVQIIHLCAALLLLLSFAMLAQRRVANLVTLFAAQGALLVVSAAVVGYSTHQAELYQSAVLTLVIKVLILPWVLFKLIHRLRADWDMETLVNIPSLQLLGIVLVIFAFVVAQPIAQFTGANMRGVLGIALALVLLAFLMMIVRHTAIAQVVGFLSMENALLFAATSATQGMPMVVELGIGLDVLVGVFVLGIFFFQIREQFDSLDLQQMESLKDD